MGLALFIFYDMDSNTKHILFPNMDSEMSKAKCFTDISKMLDKYQTIISIFEHIQYNIRISDEDKIKEWRKSLNAYLPTIGISINPDAMGTILSKSSNKC